MCSFVESEMEENLGQATGCSATRSVLLFRFISLMCGEILQSFRT